MVRAIVLLGLVSVCILAPGLVHAGDEDLRMSSIGFLPDRSKRVSVTQEAERFTVHREADDAVVLRARPRKTLHHQPLGER